MSFWSSLKRIGKKAVKAALASPYGVKIRLFAGLADAIYSRAVTMASRPNRSEREAARSEKKPIQERTAVAAAVASTRMAEVLALLEKHGGDRE